MRQTEFVILGLLSESPLTGYQIKQLIDIRFRFFWSESFGQIYPGLRSLQQQGLTEEVASPGNHSRSQKTYRIKPEGRTALRQWLEKPVETETVRLEILLKMYFSHLISAESMICHLEKFRKTHEEDLALITMMQNELKLIEDKDPDHPYVLRVIDFGQKVYQAYLDWSRETIKFLESRKEQ